MKLGISAVIIGLVCLLPSSIFAQTGNYLSIEDFAAAYDARCSCENEKLTDAAVTDKTDETDKKVSDRPHDRRHFGICRKLAAKSRKVFQYLNELDLTTVTNEQLHKFISEKKKELRECAKDARQSDRKKVHDKATDKKASDKKDEPSVNDKPAHD